jgi:hypothetical protein
VLLAAVLSCGAGAAGAEVQDLYFAQTVVTGTQEPERSRGFKAGLADVLVKLTGDARITETEALAPILEKAARYVEHFEYEDRMKGIPVHDEQGTRERPHFLRIQFRPSEVDEALKELGLSRWPADRPVVAVWLGIETASGRYVLHASGPEGYGQRAVLIETSQRRGLPITLPDALGAGSAITFEMVAAGELERLRSASLGSGALLVGILSLGKGGYWDMEWHLHSQEQTRSWSMEGVTFDLALRDGLERAALVLSGRD